MLQINNKLKTVEDLLNAAGQWTDPTTPDGLNNKQLEFLNEFFSFDVDIYSQRVVFHYFGDAVPGSSTMKLEDILAESSRLFGRAFWRLQDAGNRKMRLFKVLTADGLKIPCHIVIHEVTFDDLLLDTIEVTFARYAS